MVPAERRGSAVLVIDARRDDPEASVVSWVAAGEVREPPRRMTKQ
jgi:hypothetical protein